MRVPDLWTALAVVAIGFFVAFRAQGFPDLGGGVSPRPFPQIVGGVLMLFGAAIALRSLKLSGLASKWERPDWSHDRFAVARLVYVPLGIVAFILIVRQIGTIAASALLVGGFALLWRERWLSVIAFSVIFSALVYLFFTSVMRVSLPAGALSLPF